MQAAKGIQLTASGKFRFDIKHNGKRYTETVDTLPHANMVIAQIKAGFHNNLAATAKHKPMTLKQAGSGYVDHRVDTSHSSSVTPTTYNTYMKTLYDHFGANTLLDDITTPDCKRLFDKLVGQYSASHVNNIDSMFAGLQTYAHERGGKREPALRIGRVKAAEGRIRYLTADEEVQVLQWFAENAPDYVNLVGFYLHTGARKSEAFNLDKVDVSIENNRITFWGDRTKTGKSRSISISKRLKPILQDALDRRSNQSTLFAYLSKRKFETYWGKMRQALGLDQDDQFVIHALRHTCCTRMIGMGIDPRTAQEVMGHADIRQTMAYTHLFPSNLDAAADALDAFDSQHSQH